MNFEQTDRAYSGSECERLDVDNGHIVIDGDVGRVVVGVKRHPHNRAFHRVWTVQVFDAKTY